MKNLLLTSTAVAALFISSTASAQQTDQDVSAMISEQVASMSVEFLNATKQSVVESLEAWGDEVFTSSESDAEEQATEQSETSNEQPVK